MNNYLREHMKAFCTAFSEMETSYQIGDVDGFIKGTNRIVEQLGGTPLFESKAECDMLLGSALTIEI